MNRSFFITSILLLTCSFARTESTGFESRPTIIVFDLGGGEDHKLLGRHFSKVITSKIIKYQLATIVTRNEINRVLEEQAFQNSGCTDEACRVEIGKLLNAEKILVGKVTKVSEEIHVQLKLIGIETSEIQWAEIIKINDLDQIDQTFDSVFSIIDVKVNKELNKKGLLFWNKLDSKWDVENSVAGPPGKLNFDPIFKKAKHGFGLAVFKNREPMIHLDDITLNPLEGCVEFWVVVNESVTNYGCDYHLFNGLRKVPTYSISIKLEKNNQLVLDLSFGQKYNGSHRAYTHTRMDLPLYKPVHLGVGWVRGEKSQVYVYKDGSEFYHTNVRYWAPYPATNENPALGQCNCNYMNENEGEEKYKFILDNVKIWNYAKRNFDDRMAE